MSGVRGASNESSAPLAGGTGRARRPGAVAAGAFMGGAKSRLLPASIPFRYFGAAVAYHALAWLALLLGAQDVPMFAGGLGWPLAALHLVTLGVLVMTAIGTSLQLLPVATRQPLSWPRAPALIWWLFTPGVAAVTLGMGLPQPVVMVGGAVLVVLALSVYAVLLGGNLIGARGMPMVAFHGWVALTSLVIVVATALSLACAYAGVPVVARDTALALHVAFAGYGFMGMLALGLSYIVVPMFALSAAPDSRMAQVSCGLAAVALALAGAAALGVAPLSLRVVAIALGIAAVGLHLKLMSTALRTGMRHELGRSFTLVRISWVLLAASLAAGLAVTLDVRITGTGTLFGLTLVGWLLTFLLGILQRIVPFLASMHAAGTAPRAPTPSSLTAERPLAIHFWCHLTAVGLLAVGAVAQSAAVTVAAAVCGGVGGVALAGFFVIVQHRLRSATATVGARPLPAA